MIFSIFMVQGRKLILQMMNSIKFLEAIASDFELITAPAVKKDELDLTCF